MFDAKRLLDQFLGAGTGAAPGQGFPGGPSAPGGFGGQNALGGAGGAGDLLADLQRRAGANPLASGALAGGLAGILLGSKSGRKLATNAAKVGGMALVAGLAYRAYSDWQAKKAGQALPQETRPELAPPAGNGVFMPTGQAEEDRARLLVSAMIAAAKADGFIDAAEQKQIFEKVGSLDLDREDKAFLMDQLSAPLDLDGLVRGAGRPEVAAEIYAASLLAIDPDHPAEKAYLQMLAARLGLEESLVAEIHAKAEAARE